MKEQLIEIEKLKQIVAAREIFITTRISEKEGNEKEGKYMMSTTDPGEYSKERRQEAGN